MSNENNILKEIIKTEELIIKEMVRMDTDTKDTVIALQQEIAELRALIEELKNESEPEPEPEPGGDTAVPGEKLDIAYVIADTNNTEEADNYSNFLTYNNSFIGFKFNFKIYRTPQEQSFSTSKWHFLWLFITKENDNFNKISKIKDLFVEIIDESLNIHYNFSCEDIYFDTGESDSNKNEATTMISFKYNDKTTSETWNENVDKFHNIMKMFAVKYWGYNGVGYPGYYGQSTMLQKNDDYTPICNISFVIEDIDGNVTNTITHTVKIINDQDQSNIETSWYLEYLKENKEFLLS